MPNLKPELLRENEHNVYRLRLILVNSAYACLFWDSSSFLEGEVIDVYKTTLGSFCMTARLNIELGSKLV